MDIPVSESADWIKVNLGQHVPTRVLYSADLLGRLTRAIRSNEMSASDRAGLIGDQSALLRSGDLDIVNYLRLLSAFQAETNCVVWGALSTALDQLDRIFVDNDVLHRHYVAFARKLIRPATEHIGWDSRESDGHLGKLLRGTLIGLLALFASDDEAVVAEARKRFNAFLATEDPAVLPAEYKGAVFRVVLSAGGVDEFDRVMRRAKTTPLPAERLVCYHSMGYAADPKLKRRVLDWCLTDEVKLQDFFYPMGSVSASNREGKELAFQFFVERFDDIRRRLATASPSLMDAVIMNCCAGFHDAKKVQEVTQFFATHPVPSSTRKIDQMLESSRINVKCNERIQKYAELQSADFWASLL
jgi:hypothetical protein